MDEILTQLRAEFPSVEFDAGDDVSGYFWMIARQGDWVWERRRVTCAQSMLAFVIDALAKAADQGQISV